MPPCRSPGPVLVEADAPWGTPASACRAPPLDLGWDDVLTVLLVDPGLRAGVERGSHPVERPQMGGDRPGPLVWHIIDWNEELFVGFSTLGRQASAGWRSLPQLCGLLCGGDGPRWLLALGLHLHGPWRRPHVLADASAQCVAARLRSQCEWGQVLPRNPSLGGLDLRYVFNDLVVVFGSVLVACAVS